MFVKAMSEKEEKKKKKKQEENFGNELMMTGKMLPAMGTPSECFHWDNSGKCMGLSVHVNVMMHSAIKYKKLLKNIWRWAIE